MPSNYTENYQLSQWSRTDQVRMEDFNADNAKIDAALKVEADARTALAAEVSKLGNCRVETWSYTGNYQYGQDKPTVLTFSGKPVLAIIFARESFAFFTYGAASYPVYCKGMSNTGSGLTYSTCTWQGNSLSFYGDTPRVQMNDLYEKYYVTAFYAEDEV